MVGSLSRTSPRRKMMVAVSIAFFVTAIMFLPSPDNEEVLRMKNSKEWGETVKHAIQQSVDAGENRSWLDNQFTAPWELNRMEVCPEECKYDPEMCNDVQKTFSLFPAPWCRSRTRSDDQDPFRKPDGPQKADIAFQKVLELTKWGGRFAHTKMYPDSGCEELVTRVAGLPNEINRSSNLDDHLWPDEIEMFVKSLIRQQPVSYLHIGMQKSTSSLPVLSSGSVITLKSSTAADYPSPVLDCLESYEERLNEYEIPENLDRMLTNSQKIVNQSRAYMNYLEDTLDATGIDVFDTVVVQGKYRAATALKLLLHTAHPSVIYVLRFWELICRDAILKYYTLAGYTRALAILKPRKPMPKGWKKAYEKALPYTQYFSSKVTLKHTIVDAQC